MKKKEIKAPLFDEVKKYELYHFDKNLPDDNDIVFKPKFRGQWLDELDNFSPQQYEYNFERESTRMNWQHWVNIGYNPNSMSARMPVDKKIHKKISKIVDHIPFDESVSTQTYITEQKPMQHIPYHVDMLGTFNDGLNDQKKIAKLGYRVLVFLTDWWPGEFMQWGNTTITKWKSGDILGWPAMKYPHGTANVSLHTGYRLRLSGLISKEFESWIKNDSLIEIN